MLRFCVLGLLGLVAVPALAADPAPSPKLSLLIIDGMNNHDWPRATRILKEILGSSGWFRVDVSTSPAADAPKEAWDQWRPQFAKYDVVLSNFNGGHKPTSLHWQREVEKALEDYVSNGSVTFKASVLSHSGHRRLLRVVNDGQEKVVEKGSPYWTEIRVFDAKGKPVQGLPEEGGYFEIVLPQVFLQAKPKSLTIDWIDFYRQ